MAQNLFSQRVPTENTSIAVIVDVALTKVLLWLLRGYQIVLSPWIGGQCRFYPTCSHYSMQAIEQYGPWRGMWLTAKRLGRCHPFAEGGVDAVPTKSPSEQIDCDCNQTAETLRSDVQMSIANSSHAALKS